MPECPLCKGEKYYKKDDLWVACECYRYTSMQKMIQLSIGDVVGDIGIAEKLKNENLDRDIVFFVNVDDVRIINWTVAYFWTKTGFLGSFRKIETDDVIKIYVQSNPEVEPCKSLSDLAGYRFLALFMGFHDPTNILMPNLIANMIERRQMQDRHTWVFVKGKEFPLYSKYYYTKAGQKVLGDVVGNVVLSEFFKKSKFTLLTYEGGVPKSLGGVAGGVTDNDPCKTQRKEVPKQEVPKQEVPKQEQPVLEKKQEEKVGNPVDKFMEKTMEKRRVSKSVGELKDYTSSDPSRNFSIPKPGVRRKK